MRGKWGLFLVAGLMGACVSMKDFRAKQADLAELNLRNKDLRADVKLLKKDNKGLWDTIRNRARVLQNSTVSVPGGKTGAAKTPAVKTPEAKSPVAKTPAKTPAKPGPGKPRTYPGISIVAPPRDLSHIT